MTPLLFISIVTLVLVILVYWILASLEKRQADDEPEGTRNNLKFETAQELFKFLDPQPVLEQDVLRLQANNEYIKLYWHISSETWDSTMEKFGLKVQRKNIIIRLYDSNLSIMDVPVNDIQGGQKVKTGKFQTSYAVLGIKVKEDFVPLFLSRSLE